MEKRRRQKKRLQRADYGIFEEDRKITGGEEG